MAAEYAGTMSLMLNGTIAESTGTLVDAHKVAQIIFTMLQDTTAIIKGLPQNEAFRRLTITVDQTKYAVAIVKDRIQIVTQ